MSVKFYVNTFRQLEAEFDGEREVMITTRFLQNENVDKAADYLRDVAEEMTALYNAGQDEAAGILMDEAQAKVYAAQNAEKFMEEVSF